MKKKKKMKKIFPSFDMLCISTAYVNNNMHVSKSWRSFLRITASTARLDKPPFINRRTQLIISLKVPRLLPSSPQTASNMHKPSSISPPPAAAAAAAAASCHSQPPSSPKHCSSDPISLFANVHTKAPDSPPSSHPSIQQRLIPSIC